METRQRQPDSESRDLAALSDEELDREIEAIERAIAELEAGGEVTNNGDR